MKKTPKNFAIWTALNSDIRFFSSGPSYYGGADRSEDVLPDSTKVERNFRK